MNDPNGPIWWNGNHHLFYQLNPHAAVWGDMHWGHAISPDMVYWRHQPIALAPTPGGPDSEGCFSGSAVAFNGTPTFIYTGVQNAPPDQVTLHDGNDKLREVQMLATAEDENLVHWKKQDSPIIPQPPPGMSVTGFRDPCPWREADGWYLGIGSGERGKGGCVLLYRSQDLRNWEYLHKLAEGKPNGKATANPCDSGEMWECPDFFSINGHHCLLYSTEGKVIWTTGTYDPLQHRFTPNRSGVLDHGAYYAPKSFVDHINRRILWGWIQETRPEAEFAAAGWAGAMALPRVLTISQRGQLTFEPATEVDKLRLPFEEVSLRAGKPYRQKLATFRRELRISLTYPEVKVAVRLITNGVKAWELVVDLPGRIVSSGNISFPLPPAPWPKQTLRIFLDASVIESFILGCEALTSRVYSLRAGDTELEVDVLKGQALLTHWPLHAISSDRLTT
jgi:beta-fructofuranosidase